MSGCKMCSSFNRTNLRSQLMGKLIIGIFFISLKTLVSYIITDGKLTILDIRTNTCMLFLF